MSEIDVLTTVRVGVAAAVMVLGSYGLTGWHAPGSGLILDMMLCLVLVLSAYMLSTAAIWLTLRRQRGTSVRLSGVRWALDMIRAAPWISTAVGLLAGCLIALS